MVLLSSEGIGKRKIYDKLRAVDAGGKFYLQFQKYQ